VVRAGWPVRGVRAVGAAWAAWAAWAVRTGRADSAVGDRRAVGAGRIGCAVRTKGPKALRLGALSSVPAAAR
ncbi:hypothetical protein, partial [Streptomyces fuscigenes]|uniref:hypothetical protein n=1 Tax=Streptomyces fuscigenes TaxID=1528880 RepID=UPI001F282F3D